MSETWCTKCDSYGCIHNNEEIQALTKTNEKLLRVIEVQKIALKQIFEGPIDVSSCVDMALEALAEAEKILGE